MVSRSAVGGCGSKTMARPGGSPRAELDAPAVVIRVRILHSPRRRTRDRLAAIARYQVQSQIDAGGNAGRRDQVAVRDDVLILDHDRGGYAVPQRCERCPMGGRAVAI